jgi:hypothetical protein
MIKEGDIITWGDHVSDNEYRVDKVFYDEEWYTDCLTVELNLNGKIYYEPMVRDILPK